MALRITILDDLFNQAATLYQQAVKQGQKNFAVVVNAQVTCTMTGGLSSGQSDAIIEPQMVLTYAPGGVADITSRGVIIGAFPYGAQFSSPQPPAAAQLSIQQSPFVYLGNPYSILWQGSAFVASVDATTNIVYGPAGGQIGFVTISLCNLRLTKG